MNYTICNSLMVIKYSYILYNLHQDQDESTYWNFGLQLNAGSLSRRAFTTLFHLSSNEYIRVNRVIQITVRTGHLEHPLLFPIENQRDHQCIKRALYHLTIMFQIKENDHSRCAIHNSLRCCDCSYRSPSVPLPVTFSSPLKCTVVISVVFGWPSSSQLYCDHNLQCSGLA